MEQVPGADDHPGRRRAAWAVSFLGVTIVLGLWVIGAEVSQIRVALRLLSGEPVSLSAAAASDTFVRVAAIALAVAAVVALIAFLVWLHRASSYAHSVAYELRFSPGWAVGWFFVPVADLFRPLQIVREIWRATDRSPSASSREGRAKLPVPWFITAWWGVWLASDLVAAVNTLAFTRPQTVPQVRDLAYRQVVYLTLFVGAMVLTVVVVRALRARQDDKAASPRVAATSGGPGGDGTAPGTAPRGTSSGRMLRRGAMAVGAIAAIVAPLAVAVAVSNGTAASVANRTGGTGASSTSQWEASNAAATLCSDSMFRPAAALAAGATSACADLKLGAPVFAADCTKGTLPARLAPEIFDATGQTTTLGSVQASAGGCDLSTTSTTVTTAVLAGNAAGPADEPGSVVVVADFVPAPSASGINTLGVRVSASGELDVAVGSGGDFAVLESSGGKAPTTLLQGRFSSANANSPDLTQAVRLVVFIKAASAAAYIDGLLIGAGPTSVPDLPGGCGFSISTGDQTEPAVAKLLRLDIFAAG